MNQAAAKAKYIPRAIISSSVAFAISEPVEPRFDIIVDGSPNEVTIFQSRYFNFEAVNITAPRIIEEAKNPPERISWDDEAGLARVFSQIAESDGALAESDIGDLSANLIAIEHSGR